MILLSRIEGEHREVELYSQIPITNLYTPVVLISIFSKIIINMSIARPSQADVTKFMIVQQGKQLSGNWYYSLPICFAIAGATALFTHSFHRSLSPSGIVPRILYDRSLSPFYRHFRHFAPSLIVLGSLVSLDLYMGLWSDEK